MQNTFMLCLLISKMYLHNKSIWHKNPETEYNLKHIYGLAEVKRYYLNIIHDLTNVTSQHLWQWPYNGR